MLPQIFTVNTSSSSVRLEAFGGGAEELRPLIVTNNRLAGFHRMDKSQP